MSSNNQKGVIFIQVLCLIVLCSIVAVITAKSLMSIVQDSENAKDKTINSILTKQDVDQTTNIIIGDEVYEVTSNKEIKEDVYPVSETLKFEPDKITATIDTKYQYVNYFTLDNGVLLDYRIDAKTNFVGIPIAPTSGTLENYIVTSSNYPNLQQLRTRLINDSKYTLGFGKDKNGNYCVTNPFSIDMSSTDLNANYASTFEIPVTQNTSDIYIFKTDETHPLPITLSGLASDLTSAISDYPYIHIKYYDDDGLQLVEVSSNLPSIDSGVMNGKLAYTGIGIDLKVKETANYDIEVNNQELIYPSQNKVKFQLQHLVPVSNWHISPNIDTLKFKGCMPDTLTFERNAYFHTEKLSNSIKQIVGN